MQQNLILVTVDCLRADHVGWLGSTPSPSPNLDALAAKSRVFENAIVAGLPTYYSFPSLMAGRYPLRFGRDFIGLVGDEPTLATVLAEQGYETAAFVAGNPYAGRWTGYARGFQVFEDLVAKDDERGTETPKRVWGRAERMRAVIKHVPGAVALFDELYFRYGIVVRARKIERKGWHTWRAYPNGRVITELALKWLKERFDAPFFLWLHYMDAHRPYLPTSASPLQAFQHYNFWIRKGVTVERRKRDLPLELALYDATIRDVDTEMARLLGTLEAREDWNKTVFVLTADHGETFLEHGESDHDPVSLASELTHVPLLVHAPGLEPARVSPPISLVDLPPTLLRLLKVPIPSTFEGTARTEAVQPQDESVIAEVVDGYTREQNCNGRAMRGGLRLLSVQTRRFKLVIHFNGGRVELFDLDSDPAEQAPVPLETQRAVAARLLRAARTHLQKQGALPRTRGELDFRLELLQTQMKARGKGKE